MTWYLKPGEKKKRYPNSRVTRFISIFVAVAREAFFRQIRFREGGTTRFDVSQMQYVIDSGDKESETQDAMVHHVFQQAGEMFAQSNPAILELMHDP